MFSAGLAIHVIWWRISFPENTGKCLVGIFGGTICIVLAFGAYLEYVNPALASNTNLSFIVFLHASLLSFSLGAAYIATYPAIDVQSPSIALILEIFKGRKSGVSLDHLKTVFDEAALFSPLVVNLVNEKYVITRDGRYILTNKGRVLARGFLIWGGIMKRDKGG